MTVAISNHVGTLWGIAISLSGIRNGKNSSKKQQTLAGDCDDGIVFLMNSRQNSSPFLKVSTLGVVFKGQNQADFVAAQDISFQLERGQTLALVGESGSGKSVTALSILGLLPYPQAYHPKGSVTFKGQELLGQSEDLLRSIRGRKIAMVFQEPMTALNPLNTLEKQIGESLQVHLGFTPKQTRQRVIELLELVGFPEGVDRLNAYPHQLSGGQRQRVMIAMALACEPEILIADEPTTALDVTIQAGIIRLIQSLQKRFDMGLLLISHDLAMVAKIADHVAVMQGGKIVEYGATQQVLRNPQHTYTQHLIASEPSGHPSPVAADAPLVLQANDVHVSFSKAGTFWDSLKGKKPEQVCAVQDVSLFLKQGETLGIVGESGSGKSTLAYALLRLQSCQASCLQFEGQSLLDLSARQMRPWRQYFQIIFQDPFGSLNPRLSIAQIIAEGVAVHHPSLTPAQIDEKVCQTMTEVGLSPEGRHRYPHEFSGGQRQRVAIARALILKPKVLVLDEPTSALDRSIQAEVINLLKDLQQRYNLSYLFISHDLKVIRSLSHRIMVMQAGRVVESGLTEQIFTNPQAVYTKTLIESAFRLDE